MSFAQSLAKTLGPTQYSSAYVNEIQWRRERLHSGLAIDSLLSYAGVENANKAYPPKSREALLKLVDAIENGGKTRIAQSRALLYVFLDFSEDAEQNADSTTVAKYYASQIWMSIPEQALVKALWCLDHGKAADSLEYLGQPWNLEGADTLHEYIIESLADQKVGAVAGYLATRGSWSASNELVKSLALKGKFAEVLDIARAHQNLDYLKDVTHVAISNKQRSLELAQLPCTTEEWAVIKEELNHIILTSSPSHNDVNATNSLARDTMLVRALHTGDLETMMELKGSSEHADLFIQNFTTKA